MDERICFASPSDARRLVEIYAPYVSGTNISFELEVPGVEEFAARIEERTSVYPFLVCERGEEALGYAYAGRHHERGGYRFDVDTSVYVSAAHHRRRVGTALYTALFDILVAQGFYNAFASASASNEQSLLMHQSVGFERVGTFRNAGYKLGAWEDVVWMQKILREHDPAPSPVIGLDEVDPELVQEILEHAAGLIHP